MCGIAGFTHRDGGVAPGGILGSIQSIVHRGPDEQDEYEFQNVSRGPVQIKIVHLAAGKQPTRTENRNTILVLNGKIQNHLELRSELEQARYTFNCRSGPEVVLRVFRAWTVNTLGREAARTAPRAQKIEMEQCGWLLCACVPSREEIRTEESVWAACGTAG